MVYIILLIHLVLILAFDRSVFYGNVALLMAVLPIQKRYLSFFKKVLVFQRICLKIKLLKTFQTFSSVSLKHGGFLYGELF